MKKLILATMALVLFVSTTNAQEEATEELSPIKESVSKEDQECLQKFLMKDFMLYKATIIFPRVKSKDPKETRTAKSFAIVSYSDIISSTYTVDGIVYNDKGTGNDLIAGDEIYTSDELFKAETEEFDCYKHLKYIASPDFKAHEEIQKDFAEGNLERRSPPKGIKGFLLGLAVDFISSCSYSYTTQGTTLLGFSCSTGCLLIDCR